MILQPMSKGREDGQILSFSVFYLLFFQKVLVSWIYVLGLMRICKFMSTRYRQTIPLESKKQKDAKGYKKWIAYPRLAKIAIVEAFLWRKPMG